MRKPNYRQQKKAREDARKVRQSQKQVRRQTTDGETTEAADPVAPPEELPGNERR